MAGTPDMSVVCVVLWYYICLDIRYVCSLHRVLCTSLTHVSFKSHFQSHVFSKKLPMLSAVLKLPWIFGQRLVGPWGWSSAASWRTPWDRRWDCPAATCSGISAVQKTMLIYHSKTCTTILQEINFLFNRSSKSKPMSWNFKKESLTLSLHEQGVLKPQTV